MKHKTKKYKSKSKSIKTRRGGTKTNKISHSKKIKSLELSKKHRYTSLKTPNNSGNNLRQNLVKLCINNNWEEYDKLTQKIMSDYWNNYRMNLDNNTNNTIDFFIHLERNYDTFSDKTKMCLERCLTQLQEDAIPESMSYLDDILRIKNMNNNK